LYQVFLNVNSGEMSNGAGNCQASLAALLPGNVKRIFSQEFFSHFASRFLSSSILECRIICLLSEKVL
jgi:hypothetical protein